MVKHFHLDMGGATRFLMLLTSATTPPLLHLRCPALLRLSNRRSLVPCLYHSLPSPLPPCPPRLSKIKAANQFHSQTASTPFFDSTSSSSEVLVSQTWPEWSNFINYLSNAGYFNSQGSRLNLNEEFVGGLNLPDHFVNASSACLAFASQRPDLLGMLSRSDIEVVVEKGMPFLFRNGGDSVRKMRSFLGTAHGNNTDRAQTIDLVRFLLSYASNTVSSGNNREIVESSVRNLINQLVQLTYAPEASLSGSLQNQYPDRYGQTLTSPGAHLSNPSPAPRPSGQNIEMRRGDWVCPWCSFMNFARNMKCLECQEARPRPSGQNIDMKRGDWVCPRCSLMNFARNMKCLECQEARPKRQLTGGEWECPQCDFFNYGRNTVCLRCDCRRPGEVSFGANNSTPDLVYNATVDSRLAANEEKAQRWFSKISQLDSNSDMNSAIEDKDFPEIMPLRKGVNRFVVSTRKSPLERRLANSQYLSSSGDASEKSTLNLNPSQSLDPSLSNQREEEQDEKSERWFKRVAELHNMTDPANEIPDEDFPEIMPMRKGENRFVVSKRKDRSLTSPVYKRRTATEQASNSNFVPFVPFPPDYFARKDNQEPPNGSSNNIASGPSNSGSSLTGPAQQMENRSINTGNISSKTREKNQFSEGASLTGEYSTQNVIDSQPSSSRSEQSSGNNFSGARNSRENLSETPKEGNENENVMGSWSGKSLEGSAVKEPDPLDMSEEAKAERWFRRVAQIKDISELSEIPDEDFPSIMPMRKGVNRFVVSKRKTPLERRLTSTQYRRNLPVMNSDPLKENDSS